MIVNMDDGWDDDFDVDDIVGSGDIPPNKSDILKKFENIKSGSALNGDFISEAMSACTNTVDVDGWDDDDLDLDIADNDTIHPIQVNLNVDKSNESQGRPTLSPTEDGFLRSLRDYMKSLPDVVASLRAVLEAEYNTYEHALHLQEYYESRPQLRDYTVATELPRMEYTVVTSSSSVLVEKQHVADFVLSQPNTILFRCANQSLLADVLAVLTGPDLFIRTQYLATAVASTCRFILHQANVRCDCTINLSLPGISGQRVDIAQLNLSIDFQPEIPSVHYCLKDVVMLVDDYEDAWLEGSAMFLASMSSHDDYFCESESYPTNADAFRDSLLLHLSKTHQIVQSSQTGLSSAWKQLDSVTSVTKKLDFVKRVGGGFIPSLPSADLVIAAGDNFGQDVSPVLQHSHRPGPALFPNDSSDHHRPAPILGGFILSGLTRLAKSVATSEAEQPGSEPLSSRIDCMPFDHFVATRSNTTPLTVHTVGKTANFDGHQVVANSGTTNSCSHSRFELDQHEKDENRNSDTGIEVDGWGDDDLSFEDELQHDENLPSSQVVSLLSRSIPPTPLNYPVDGSGVESLSIKTVKKTMFPTPLHSHADGYSAGFATLSSVPVSHETTADDVIPTRKRWMNPRMIGS